MGRRDPVQFGLYPTFPGFCTFRLGLEIGSTPKRRSCLDRTLRSVRPGREELSLTRTGLDTTLVRPFPGAPDHQPWFGPLFYPGRPVAGLVVGLPAPESASAYLRPRNDLIASVFHQGNDTVLRRGFRTRG